MGVRKGAHCTHSVQGVAGEAELRRGVVAAGAGNTASFPTNRKRGIQIAADSGKVGNPPMAMAAG